MSRTNPHPVPAPDRGILKDPQPYQLPDQAWADGKNVWFGHGEAGKGPGFLKATNTTQTPSDALGTKVLFGIPLRFFEAKFYDGLRYFLAFTTTDAFRWDPTNSEWIVITRIYTTATVNNIVDNNPDGSHFKVTGNAGTAWDTGVSVGDYFRINADANGTWFKISAINSPTEIICEGHHANAAGNYTIRKIYKADIKQRWNVRMLSNKVIAVQGADVPQKWTGSGNMVALGGVSGNFDAADFLCIMEDKAVMAGLTEGGGAKPVRYRNSNRNDPEAWTPSSSSEANFDDLQEGADFISGLEEIGRNAVGYKKDKIYLLEDLGSPLFIGNQIIEPRVGLLYPGLVVNLGKAHLFWGRDGLYRTDGYNVVPEEVARGVEALSNFFLADLNFSLGMTAFSIVDRKNSLAFWFYPGQDAVSEPNKALIYNYKKRVWSIYTSDMFAGITAAGLRERTETTSEQIDALGAHRLGTVDVSANGLTVSANPAGSTLFTTNPNLNAGDLFKVDEDADLAINWIPIASVDNDNQITLAQPYPIAPKVAKAYKISALGTDELQGYYDQASFLEGAMEVWLADKGGITYKMGNYSKDSKEYEAYLETKDMEFGTREYAKFCDGIIMNTNRVADTYLEVWVGTRNSLDEEIVWNGPYPHLLFGAGGRVNFVREAIWFRFRFRTMGMNDPWMIQGYEPMIKHSALTFIPAKDIMTNAPSRFLGVE